MCDTFGCPFSFESTENKAMAKTVLVEVQSVYGMEKWKKAVIKDAVHQHWMSLRDDFTTKSSKKYEEHRRNVKQNNSPEKKTFLASNAIEYMSSEESDIGATENENSRGPKPRKIRKLR
ncbi:uncharacterized protein LOC141885900 [Acropora palmata]|uniref:uncharacterized protein LOC141885900 n=1 Tax=Acropora palmata TaxID=6131 RepID=UPI003DA07E9B